MTKEKDYVIINLESEESKMIEECKCPKCGKMIESYYNNSRGMEFSDDDTIFIDYDCHCSCGTKFVYTEWYKLAETQVEKI